MASGKLGTGLPIRLGAVETATATGTFGFGQAQASIKATGQGFGQAQAFIYGVLFVQSSSNVSAAGIWATTGGGGTFSTTLPSTPSQGNFQIAVISMQGDGTVTLAGWYLVTDNVDAEAHVWVYARVVPSTPSATITATNTSGSNRDIAIMAAEYYGLGPNPVITAPSWNLTGSAGSVAMPAQTPRDVAITGQAVLFGAADFRIFFGNGTWSSWSERTHYDGGSQHVLEIADKIISNPDGVTTYNETVTGNGTAPLWRAVDFIITAHDTREVFGNAQAQIKVHAYGFGQAQAAIKVTSLEFGQAQALIGHLQFGQAAAIINNQPFVYADDFNRVSTGFGTNGAVTYTSIGSTEADLDGETASVSVPDVADYTDFPASPFGTILLDFWVPADTTAAIGYAVIAGTIVYDETGISTDYIIQLIPNGDGTWLEGVNAVFSTFTPDPSTWYTVKTFKTGSFLAIKVWKRDDPEPEVWDAEGAPDIDGAGALPQIIIFGSVDNLGKIDNYAQFDALGQGYGQAQAFISGGQTSQFGQAQAFIDQPLGWAFGQAQARIITNHLFFPEFEFQGYRFEIPGNTIAPEFYVPEDTDVTVVITEALSGFTVMDSASQYLVLANFETGYGELINPFDGSVGRYTFHTAPGVGTRAYLLIAVPLSFGFDPTLTGAGYVIDYTKIRQMAMGQAQATILPSPQAYGQAQAHIFGVSRAYGQAQAFILKSAGYGQAQADILATDNTFGQAQADIKQTYPAFGLALSDIKQTYRVVAQSQANIAYRSFHVGQAAATIIREDQPSPNPSGRDFGPPEYVVIYDNFQLAGYPQSESIMTTVNLADLEAFEWDGATTQNIGLSNFTLSITFAIYDVAGWHSAKTQYLLTRSRLLSSQGDYRALNIDGHEGSYRAQIKSVNYSKDVTTNRRLLEYTVEFECQPWAISEIPRSLASFSSGILTTDDVNRTINDGTWTPTIINLTGTNVTVSGYTDTESTGYISVSGYVSGMIIDSEQATVTVFDGNGEPYLYSVDPQMYVGVGKTSFETTGVDNITISYKNRWL